MAALDPPLAPEMDGIMLAWPIMLAPIGFHLQHGYKHTLIPRLLKVLVLPISRGAGLYILLLLTPHSVILFMIGNDGLLEQTCALPDLESLKHI